MEHVEIWTKQYDGHGGICISDREGRQIGFVSPGKNQDSHARLMAAAPELLEALESILEMCDGYVPNTSKAEWAKAYAAIDKARGE